MTKKQEIHPEYDRTKKKPVSKIKLMILSVITSVVLWVVIVQIVNPEIAYEIKNVPVTFSGEGTLRDRNIVLMNKEEISGFDVKISGRRNEVISSMDRVRINIDVSQVTQLGSFELMPSVYVPPAINSEQHNIKSVVLDFEACTTKEVPVVAGYTGIGRNEVIEIEPQLKTVTVTGAVSQINKLEKCLITVDGSVIDEEYEGVYKFVYSDAAGEPLEECQTFFCNVSAIKAVSRVYNKVQVPFKIVSDDKLKEKCVIEIDKNSIPEYVDGGMRNAAEVVPEVRFIIPDGEYENGRQEFTAVLEENSDVFISQKSMNVAGTVTKLKTRPVRVNIEPVNVPEGMSVSFEQAITVNLTAPENITETVKGFIDLTGKQPGEYDIPVVFEDAKIFGKNLSVKVSITGE